LLRQEQDIVTEFEGGNRDITTDTTLKMVYGENNLITFAQASMDAGVAMQIVAENVGDTIRYMGEIKMTGFAADMMDAAGEKGKKQAQKKVMDIVFNKETEMYEACEKQRGGIYKKLIIDKEGRTLESIITMKDEMIRHEKFSYEGQELVGSELITGEPAEVVLNAAGQKVSETTYRGIFMYEYDEKGNLSKKIELDPRSKDLTYLTKYTYYYGK